MQRSPFGHILSSKKLVMLGREYIPGGSRGRMDHEREVPGFEYGRATKHSASHVVKAEEAELSEMFHKVLLVVAPCSTECCQSTDAGQSKDSRPDPQVRGSNGGREQGSRQRNKSSVDLRTLLILEARMVGNGEGTQNFCEAILPKGVQWPTC
ncbi:uncharacterized protein LOC116198838 [Punica granatum]|uniref:Uncharacterized protein LOC116198838 n=1 Tax=Punica granatum TaxID=22663 RepID=A0A6P8CRS3_PUNGR|nr:uncharacterized protein LOC116198838 [Punica granatum]